MKKFLYIIVLVIAGLVGKFIVKALFDKPNVDLIAQYDAEKKQMLIKTAAEINQQLPIMLDSETRLDYVMAFSSSEIFYNYTLVNYAYADFTSEGIKMLYSSMKEQIVENACRDPKVKKLLKLNITMTYKYKSNDSRELMDFSLTNEQCKQAGIIDVDRDKNGIIRN